MKKLLGMAALFLCVAGFAGCNDDDAKFSSKEIQQALFDMKGAYKGTVDVSYYQGERIASFSDGKVVSKDSLQFTLPLSPIAELIQDETASRYLKEIGEVEVKAGYEFLQMDQGSMNFLLRPKEVIIWGGYGAPPTIKIAFSQNYGGNAETSNQSMVFNVSPVEVWIGDKKSEDFSPLVYHFSGKYE